MESKAVIISQTKDRCEEPRGYKGWYENHATVRCLFEPDVSAQARVTAETVRDAGKRVLILLRIRQAGRLRGDL